MVQQVILKDRIFWLGKPLEVCDYLRQLSRQYETVSQLINAKLH